MCRNSEKKRNTHKHKVFLGYVEKYYLSLGFVESKISLNVLLK